MLKVLLKASSALLTVESQTKSPGPELGVVFHAILFHEIDIFFPVYWGVSIMRGLGNNGIMCHWLGLLNLFYVWFPEEVSECLVYHAESEDVFIVDPASSQLHIILT